MSISPHFFTFVGLVQGCLKVSCYFMKCLIVLSFLFFSQSVIFSLFFYSQSHLVKVKTQSMIESVSQLMKPFVFMNIFYLRDGDDEAIDIINFLIIWISIIDSILSYLIKHFKRENAAFIPHFTHIHTCMHTHTCVDVCLYLCLYVCLCVFI